MRLCAIGDRGMIMGFRSLGIDLFEASTPKEVEKVLSDLREDDIALVKEDLLVGLDPEILKGRWIVSIPGRKSTGFSADRIKKMVERAIGMELR
jgi:V/A-type H+-transporting ATPase subunit F